MTHGEKIYEKIKEELLRKMKIELLEKYKTFLLDPTLSTFLGTETADGKVL